MTTPPYESSRECAICEEEGDATAPLRWRWTLNRAHKLLVHTTCYDAEVAHIRAEQNDPESR